MSSTQITRDLETVQSELAQAEQQAATATGEDLGAIGGMVAGLRAKIEALQGQRTAAQRKEQERAAQELAQHKAEERRAAIVVLEERRTSIVATFAEWESDMLGEEDRVVALWGRYDALQASIRKHTKDAQALGADVPIILEPSQRMRRLQTGLSPAIKWPARRNMAR